MINKQKAPGMDGILPETLKLFVKHNPQNIVRILNGLLR